MVDRRGASSTLFSHVASDKELKPLGPFATEEAIKAVPNDYGGRPYGVDPPED